MALLLDARRPAHGALGFAFERARLLGARLRAVHAWSPPGDAARERPFPVPEADRARWEDQEVQALSDALRPWRARYPDVRVVPDVVRFTADEALAWAVPRSQLLVVSPGGPHLDRSLRALVARSCGALVVVPW
ncbi:universal stress protein [Streptomyces sp. VRA16 Mangrove soil]|nr:universal stress protein [Streptomyces sp. VRA16 Mangrove soil]